KLQRGRKESLARLLSPNDGANFATTSTAVVWRFRRPFVSPFLRRSRNLRAIFCAIFAIVTPRRRSAARKHRTSLVSILARRGSNLSEPGPDRKYKTAATIRSLEALPL